ncbi:hypothetical protein GJ496_007991 [Pomphorhynchus laevis]|nr:hypothetical protein GJ496_007991 [Pomphorhynchus laevis]
MTVQIDEELLQKLKDYDQTHVLKYWDSLTDDEKQQLLSQLRSVSFDTLKKAIKQSKCGDSLSQELLHPPDQDIVSSIKNLTADTVRDLKIQGLRAIANGEVGFIILAGGQGTRLNTPYPKGMFDIGLLSGKTLFQLQAEQLIRIKQLSSSSGMKCNSIPWYIMTSEHTLKDTADFFESHNYFNYPKEDVVMFEQNHLPSLHFNGKIALIEKGKIGIAPDGNGGLFSVLKSTKMLDDMRSRGIKYLHVCGVDNILNRILDPVFIGVSLKNQADCSLKVVKKTRWNEALGIVSSKIDPENSSLYFCHGNICNHFFTLEFLEIIAKNYCDQMKFHIAKKKMKCIDLENAITIQPDSPNVMKFEKFIFDVVPFSKNFHVLEVKREKEFSPLKNALPNPDESPISCIRDLKNLHMEWLRKVGVVFDCDDKHIEISPLVSYEGENLEKLKEITFPKKALIELINGQIQVINKEN